MYFFVMESAWFFYALGAAAVWGLVYVLDERVFHYISTLQFMWISSLFSFIFLTGYFLISGTEPGIKTIYAYGMGPVALLAVTVIICFLGSFMIYTSIQASNATLAALIETSYPLFTFFFAWLLFRDVQVTLISVAGGGVTIMGLYLIYLGAR